MVLVEDLEPFIRLGLSFKEDQRKQILLCGVLAVYGCSNKLPQMA